MKKSFKIIAFLIPFLVNNLFAQETEPDTSIVLKSFSLDPLSNARQENPIDTTLEPVHQYNPIFYHSFSQTYTGNTGQASITNNLQKRQSDNPFVFNLPYLYYIYTPYSIHHFNTRKPFTELRYTTSGSRDDSEQVLSALHTQNVNPDLNVGVLYDLIASKGVYNNQNTGLNRVALFGSYVGSEYSMHTSLHYNGLKYQENGGIKNLEEFKNEENDALNYQTNLDEASSRLRNINLFYTHNLNASALFSDSLQKEKFDNFLFQHSIQYQRFNRIYSDVTNQQDSLRFYQNNFYLTDEITDSAFYHNISNRLDLKIILAESQSLLTYIKHEYKKFSYILPAEASYEIEGQRVDTVIKTYPSENYNDISVGGIYEGVLRNWDYSAFGEFFISGYRAGDLLANGHFTRFFKDRSFFLTMGGEFSSKKPSFFLTQYGGAHFKWNNSFRNTENINAYASIGSEKAFNLQLSLDLFTDYVYINQEAEPEQTTEELLTATLKLNKKFTWGPVNHRHDLLIQKGAEDYIHVPLLAYKNATWYENALFNKVLKLRIGFEVYYFTPYFADAFMPATAMFYTQKNEEIGNYPFAKGFIDLKLKRTRFSIQYTNALAGLLPTANYFMAYAYPTFNSTFRFSLAWTFYD